MEKLFILFILAAFALGSCSDEIETIPEEKEEEPTVPPITEEAESKLPVLRVEGRYLKNESGNIVNLHGYAQTFSPWFNEQGTKWSNYDVAGCLRYNKGIIDGIMAAGWKMNFVRMHMDPYWS